LRSLRPILVRAYTFAHKFSVTPWNKVRNSRKKMRMLEIGPGRERIPGFETLNIIGGRNVDYVGDASKRLSFAPGTFDLIYASHVLEHIPWYRSSLVIADWSRSLKSGGWLEIWVPD